MSWTGRSCFDWIPNDEVEGLFGLPAPPKPQLLMSLALWEIILTEDRICLGLLDRACTPKGQFLCSTERVHELFEDQPPIEQRWIGNMR